MKQCNCEDSHIWYGMKVLLDENNVFYQVCPNCKGRIETGEQFNKQECDEVYNKINLPCWTDSGKE